MDNKYYAQHGVCQKFGWAEVHSAVLQIQAAVQAEQATLNFKS
jgi:hypothetical protein